MLAHMFLDYLLDFDNAMTNFSWLGYQPPQQRGRGAAREAAVHSRQPADGRGAGDHLEAGSRELELPATPTRCGSRPGSRSRLVTAAAGTARRAPRGVVSPTFWPASPSRASSGWGSCSWSRFTSCSRWLGTFDPLPPAGADLESAPVDPERSATSCPGSSKILPRAGVPAGRSCSSARWPSCSLLIAYPVAYYVARYAGRKGLLLLLLIAPFWISYIMRISRGPPSSTTTAW